MDTLYYACIRDAKTGKISKKVSSNQLTREQAENFLKKYYKQAWLNCEAIPQPIYHHYFKQGGKMATLPSNAKLIKTVEIEFQYDVKLYKTGKRFAVVYGADVRINLDYSQACDNLGQCIIHALQCNGLFD